MCGSVVDNKQLHMHIDPKWVHSHSPKMLSIPLVVMCTIFMRDLPRAGQTHCTGLSSNLHLLMLLHLDFVDPTTTLCFLLLMTYFNHYHIFAMRCSSTCMSKALVKCTMTEPTRLLVLSSSLPPCSPKHPVYFDLA